MAKGMLMSNITIYRRAEDGDRLIRLIYEPREVRVQREVGTEE